MALISGVHSSGFTSSPPQGFSGGLVVLEDILHHEGGMVAVVLDLLELLVVILIPNHRSGKGGLGGVGS